MTKLKRTTLFLSQDDRDAIEHIKLRYGVSSTSDAVRLAVRVLSCGDGFPVKQEPKQEGQQWTK